MYFILGLISGCILVMILELIKTIKNKIF